MRKREYRIIMVYLLALSLIAGCGPQLSKEQKQSGQQGIPSHSGQESNRAKSEQINGKNTISSSGASPIPTTAQSGGKITFSLITFNGTGYVLGNDFARKLGYEVQWDADRNVYQIGDHDAAYELTVDRKEAVKDDLPIALAEPPVLYNSQVYIPASAFPQLFSEEVACEVKDGSLVVSGLDLSVTEAIDGPEEVNTGSEEDFEDDPTDPYKGEASASETEATAETVSRVLLEELQGDSQEGFNEPSVNVMRNIDPNSIISRAKRYLGVNYLFGAAPYPISGKFDCSTFARYIFAKYNVKLNRTARAQAKQGNEVSRKSLRKGDLMFFYVPGRFRSNKTVGHVGIYMGNQRMIHCSPAPENGVQISNINSAYWKKTFMAARRVI